MRGLIDAYGLTATKALELAGRVERVNTKPLRISLGYSAVGSVTRLLEGAGAMNLEWDYGESVNVAAEVPVSAVEYLSRELDELRARKIIAGWEEL